MAYDWLLGVDDSGQLSPEMVPILAEQLGVGGDGTVAWQDVSERPSAFPPETHTHSVNQIDGLDDRLSEIGAGTVVVAEDLADLSEQVTAVRGQVQSLESRASSVEARTSSVESRTASVELRTDNVEVTVDRIKLANTSMGSGAPTGTAPVGWHYTDITTGDIYRMEA